MSEKINTPPQCLDTAEMCQGCTENCSFLRFGLEKKTLELQNRALMHDKDRSDIYLKNGFLTYLEHNKDLQEEISKGNFGVIFMDLRGLKAANDAISMIAGDHLIEGIASEIMSVVTDNTRTKSKPKHETTEENRRNPEVADYPVHWGTGDEFVVLVSDVDESELLLLVERFSDLFSPSRAIKKDRECRPPVVASVAGAHHKDLVPKKKISSKFLPRLRKPKVLSPKEMILATVEKAQENHQSCAKSEQYQKMLDLINDFKENKASEDEAGEIEVLLNSSDNRFAAVAFYKYLCKNYYEREKTRDITEVSTTARSLKKVWSLISRS